MEENFVRNNKITILEKVSNDKETLLKLKIQSIFHTVFVFL